MKLPSSAYDYDVISDSWFLILKMNGYLAASVYRFHVLEKQKLIKTDRLSHVGWPTLSKGKVLWKTTTKSIFYWEESITF